MGDDLARFESSKGGERGDTHGPDAVVERVAFAVGKQLVEGMGAEVAEQKEIGGAKVAARIAAGIQVRIRGQIGVHGTAVVLVIGTERRSPESVGSSGINNGFREKCKAPVAEKLFIGIILCRKIGNKGDEIGNPGLQAAVGRVQNVGSGDMLLMPAAVTQAQLAQAALFEQVEPLSGQFGGGRPETVGHNAGIDAQLPAEVYQLQDVIKIKERFARRKADTGDVGCGHIPDDFLGPGQLHFLMVKVGVGGHAVGASDVAAG